MREDRCATAAQCREESLTPSPLPLRARPLRALSVCAASLFCRGCSLCDGAAADHWIIGRRVGEREFYMLLDQKQYTLAQANNEIDRLCSTFFSNIYM